jgi:DNA-binding response OmpR family regulator
VHRLLVTSEDADLRRYVRITLERAGYAVNEARGLTDALSRLAGTDLVVWDLAHDEAAEQVSRAVANVPLVVLASGLPHERAAGRATLLKPFDPGELVELCRAVLHQPTA